MKKKSSTSSNLLGLIAQGLRTGRIRQAAATLVFTASSLSLAPFAKAEETTGEKVNSEVRQGKRAVKKKARAVKKEVRDATGNGDTTQDAKDALDNAKDSTTDTAKDIKNKVD